MDDVQSVTKVFELYVISCSVTGTDESRLKDHLLVFNLFLFIDRRKSIMNKRT